MLSTRRVHCILNVLAKTAICHVGPDSDVFIDLLMDYLFS